jgi:hypothetical protein
MHTALTLIARLLPALAGAPPAAADTALLPVPVRTETAAPLVMASTIDWAALRGEAPLIADTARTRNRARAVEYSGFYQARLKLHRALSWSMIPLFIGSYATGDQILKHRSNPPKWATTLHKPFAYATGAVFTVNTVTGLWNLWDSRKNPEGQVKRTIHSLLFLAATAGFTYAGTSLAHDANNREDRNHFHKTVAMASMGVSIVSWGMMVFFK